MKRRYFAANFGLSALLASMPAQAQDSAWVESSALATPPAAAIAIDSHGTERVRCESGWFGTPGEAERDCDRRLDAEIGRVEARLRREGKEVIGHQTFAADCEERQRSGREYVEFRCTRRVEINWNHANAAGPSDELAQALSQAIHASGNKLNAVSFLAAASDQSRPSGSFIVIEDELLAKFKAAYRGGYENMTLDKVIVPASSVRVGDRISSLPQTVVEDNYVVINDTPNTQTRTVRLTLEETVGESYSFARELVSRSSTTNSISINVSGIPLGGGATGGGETGSETTTERSIRLTNESGKTFTRRTSRDEEFDVSVPGNSALYIQAQRTTFNNIYDLQGSALFDGTVTVSWRRKEMVPCGPLRVNRCPKYHNESKQMNLSQLLPVAQRTYDMSGQVTISSNNASETRLRYGTKPIDRAEVDLTDPNGQKQALVPERDYYKLDAAPADIVWRDTPTRRCGFWIFTYECRG